MITSILCLCTECVMCDCVMVNVSCARMPLHTQCRLPPRQISRWFTIKTHNNSLNDYQLRMLGYGEERAEGNTRLWILQAAFINIHLGMHICSCRLEHSLSSSPIFPYHVRAHVFVWNFKRTLNDHMHCIFPIWLIIMIPLNALTRAHWYFSFSKSQPFSSIWNFAVTFALHLYSVVCLRTGIVQKWGAFSFEWLHSYTSKFIK